MKKYSQEWVDLVRASIRDTQDERDALNRARSGELSPLSNEAKRVLALEAENAQLRAALGDLWELTFDFDVRDDIISNAQDKDFRLGEYEPYFDNQERALSVLWQVAELLSDHAYMGTAKRTPHDRR